MYPAYPPYPHHADPTAKQMIPAHMKMDLSSPWPYASNYPYPVPHQYHGCCHYGGAPYTFCPPYTHYPPPPPPPVHPYGLYPPFQGAYPFAPQHYPVEQPRNDYNHAPHHCCGCSHQEDEKRPKIKEEPQVDNKTKTIDSLALKDRPDYPIMWVPRGYTEPKEEGSRDPERSKYPIMWVPRGYTEPKEEKRSRDPESPKRGEQGGDGNRFPFQIFWLPYKDETKDTKENNLDLLANKGLLDEKTTKNDVEGECQTSNKHVVQKASTNKEETSKKPVVQKVIPVKQASTKEEKKNPESVNTMANSDSVNETDKGSKASPKTSKLPPVCLRIDPLPRKKKTSRSPSPLGKEKSNVNDPKSSPQQPQVFKMKKEEQSESNIKPLDHANKVEKSNVNNPKPSQQQPQVLNMNKEEQSEANTKPLDHANKVELDTLTENVPMGGDESEKGKIQEKKKLSEHEAALIIQSVYRGFEVRKSQPLKKLRQIYEVRKQVSELRNRIQDLESSSSTVGIDDKKQVIIIGETIMSLLLKLDTIQGLHPFVREVRKSVAKELVGLQEKLDSLTFVKPETPSECSPQQVMHHEEEGKSYEAQSQTISCENHVHEDTESQHDDDAEACNIEQHLVKSTTDDDDTIQDKFNQAPTEDNHEVTATESEEGFNTFSEPQLESYKEKLDQATESGEAMGLCENHEVVATESQEGGDAIDEAQLESHKDQAPTESDEARGLCENHEVEAIESQKGCDVVDEAELELRKEIFDQAPTESDEARGLGESQEVESTYAQEGYGEPQLGSHNEKFDQAPTGCGEVVEPFENHQAAATESQEGCNAIDEAQLESRKEIFNQAPTESDEARGQEVEAKESQEYCGEPELGSNKGKFDQAPTESDEAMWPCDNHEVADTQSQDKFGEPQLESRKDEVLTESDEAIVVSENPEMEATGSEEGIGKTQLEPDKEKLDQCENEAIDLGGVETHDMKVEHNSGGLKEVHVDDSIVPGTNVETMMHDSEVESYNGGGGEVEPHVVSSEHGNVQMTDVSIKSEAKADEVEGRATDEEKERLRVAVEELMKAGNEQLGVIKELTGRVKDLERKLARKKKIKVNNNKRGRSRGCVVQKD